MVMKIDRDASRFKQIVRGKIRENLRKYVTHGEMIGRKGNDLVSIPCRSSTCRTSATARTARRRGPGRGRNRPADRRGDPDGDGGQGQAGQRSRRPTCWKSTSRSRSWRPSWATSLELPRIEPKGKANIQQDKVRYTASAASAPSRSATSGPMSKRSSGSFPKALPPGRARVVVPIKDDRRYRSWEHVPEPVSQCGHHLHDGRLAAR
jgi:uncharacterized protein